MRFSRHGNYSPISQLHEQQQQRESSDRLRWPLVGRLYPPQRTHVRAQVRIHVSRRPPCSHGHPQAIRQRNSAQCLLHAAFRCHHVWDMRLHVCEKLTLPQRRERARVLGLPLRCCCCYKAPPGAADCWMTRFIRAGTYPQRSALLLMMAEPARWINASAVTSLSARLVHCSQLAVGRLRSSASAALY